jgi:uncharacterized membrane protein
MDVILIAHIFGGSLAIAAGFVAIAAPKGASWHRKSGMVFFYAMLLMATLAVFMAAFRGVAPGINIPMGLLTLYLVVTGVNAVRPPGRPRVRRHLVRLCLALFIATGSALLGQADEIPRELRMQTQGVRAMLALTPLAVMMFWLVKLRRRRGARQVGTPLHPPGALDAVR